ncbi:MAG: phosphotransferase [Caulobacterales bacterium]
MSDLKTQIAEAYKRDQERGFRPVARADELPNSFDEITDEWLTATLCGAVAGAKVVGHQLGPVDDGSSNRRRMTVRYNAAGEDAKLPEKLFCKASHALQNRMVLGISGGAFSEVEFYKSVRPLLAIEAPVGYFASLDPVSFNSMIMLGDITDDVTEFCNHHTKMPRARVESQLRLLAEMHGKGYSDPKVIKEISKFETWPDYFNCTLAFGMKEGSEQGFIMAESVVPPAVYLRQKEIWPATMASIDMHRKLPITFGHGDVHLKNWYVAGNGEMGLGDWQCAHRGHWSRDFAYTVSVGLPTEDRRAWEVDLLKFYLDRMQAAGGPAVAFDDAWTYYRQQLMTALTWWTITLNPTPTIPDMQPKDITLEFVRRITTAMDDLKTLDSFS